MFDERTLNLICLQQNECLQVICPNSNCSRESWKTLKSIPDIFIVSFDEPLHVILILKSPGFNKSLNVDS